VQPTDGYLWLVFSAHRSIPAFPTPLRRVIGHHFGPGSGFARANCFSGGLVFTLGSHKPTISASQISSLGGSLVQGWKLFSQAFSSMKRPDNKCRAGRCRQTKEHE
jgi:hypothetical protein